VGRGGESSARSKSADGVFTLWTFGLIDKA
jgi:hypothetical protein